MDRTDLKQLTTLLAALAGVATAIGSCNQAAQERLKADNKIYDTLANAQGAQAKELVSLHNEMSELRGYLEGLRKESVPPPEPPAETAAPTRTLLRLGRLGGASALPAPAPILKPLPPPLPPAAPAPVLRPLPKFSEL
jgi:hypothetical protein